ncbi:GMC oxidoreductase [Periconia macrospinosa]|uniref:GMC oxidoreductase n=1 Tax=Periconia macrospinosa TaxID=97972 RepID=A0A2V1DC54_9PLEO|nr:GMC oxidoreductase [Periconia macrospinosa]
MRPLPFLAALVISSTAAATNTTYEYIVVGSGPGGGPLAANLARAGHSVLLLEAGDDQGANPNISQILNFNKAGNDPKTRWDFFVKHSDEPERERKFEHYVYRQRDGSFYVGTTPPDSAAELGIYYPRAGTLGGCAMHNAGVSANAADRDWDYIAEITGDASWKAEEMRKHLVSLENAAYAPNDRTHGHAGYLTLTQARVSMGNGSDGAAMVRVAAETVGQGNVAPEVLVKRDMNANDAARDMRTGVFGQIRHADAEGRRVGTNTFIRATLDDPRRFPLTVSLNSLVTKVLFEQTNGAAPKAIGVEYMEGQSLYRADPRSSSNTTGTLKRVTASREVIVAGGVFNTPQILMLSGVGPAAELQRWEIPMVVDLPGVGTRMADNYETSLIGLAQRDFVNVSGTHAVMLKSAAAAAANRTRDLYLFCGSFSFEGYWPGFPAEYGKSQYECAVVHMNPHSQAGTVTLRSADPRDMPKINFRFYEDGEDEDLTAILDGVKWARSTLAQAPKDIAPFKELHPCKSPRTNCTDAEQKEWIKLNTYSHHATSSCQIGGDGDRLAVLDSKFRVRGVKNLRVVDASAFPKVPGAFPVLPTFMLSQKALADILADVH